MKGSGVEGRSMQEDEVGKVQVQGRKERADLGHGVTLSPKECCRDKVASFTVVLRKEMKT